MATNWQETSVMFDEYRYMIPRTHKPKIQTDAVTLLKRLEAEEQVRRALDDLSPRERLIIHAYYEQEMTVKEMAEMFYLGAQEAKSTLTAAVHKLRRAMK